MYSLYRITSQINGKAYIGITKDASRRLNEHLNTNVKGSKLLKNAIRKHGRENFLAEVLVVCSSQEYIQQLEKKAVALFNTKTPHGYNLTDGGEGIAGYSHTTEAKEKIRQSSLKKRHTKETRARMCVIQRQLAQSRPETWRQNVIAAASLPKSENTRMKLREAWVRRRARMKENDSGTL